MDCYRERAHLLALLACHYPAKFYSPDDAEPGFDHALEIVINGTRCSWHIANEDTDLFPHVGWAPMRWDGTTTEQKYDAIHEHVCALKRLPREACVLRHKG